MKYQVAIIGGGPAGYTAAEAAARAGLSVVLFEKRALGGVCLNEGCIPAEVCRRRAGAHVRPAQNHCPQAESSAQAGAGHQVPADGRRRDNGHG